MPHDPSQSVANTGINPNAAKFIDWAIAKIDDKTAYEAAVKLVHQRVDEFYATHTQDELVSRLKAKMIRGAQEHGEPFYPPEVLKDEIANEYIDLLGWMLIEEWNQNNTAPKKEENEPSV